MFNAVKFFKYFQCKIFIIFLFLSHNYSMWCKMKEQTKYAMDTPHCWATSKTLQINYTCISFLVDIFPVTILKQVKYCNWGKTVSVSKLSLKADFWRESSNFCYYKKLLFLFCCCFSSLFFFPFLEFIETFGTKKFLFLFWNDNISEVLAQLIIISEYKVVLIFIGWKNNNVN